jgi:hypothetical protein
MSCLPASPETPLRLPSIWLGLPNELQQQAVRLLAQLAYAHVRHGSPPFTKEIDYGSSTQQSQDSSGPS